MSPKNSHISPSPTKPFPAMAKPSETSPLLPPPNPNPNPNPYYSEPAPSIPYYYASPVAAPAPSAVILCLRRRRARPCCSTSSLLTLSFVIVLLLLSLFFLYPSDPSLSVSRIDLSRLRISTSPPISLTISIGIEVRIKNSDFFSIDYTYLNSSILYRGRWLGSMTSGSGHVKARGVSYVKADLHLDGIGVLSDVVYLIEDLASGRVPFETVTEIIGDVKIFFIDVPVKGKISCSVEVNPENQTIMKQDCYPA